MSDLLEIIYEDTVLIVCRKMAGIPVQTAKFIFKDMVSLLKNYRMDKGETPEIYLIHRLDQPVEGIMLFAKTKKSASFLSEQMRQRSISKYYKAVVEGEIQPKEGRLNDWLLRDGKTNSSKVVPPNTKGAKKASLSYRVLEYVKDKTLVEIALETGRHHQIRVQMAHAGHPLIGDRKYNPKSRTGHVPIGLCAVELGFMHPENGQQMEFYLEPKGEAFQIFNPIMPV